MLGTAKEDSPGGVRTSNLERAVFQRSLIDAAQHEKLDKVLKAADKVREKFGFDALQLARSVDRVTSPRARPESSWGENKPEFLRLFVSSHLKM